MIKSVVKQQYRGHKPENRIREGVGITSQKTKKEKNKTGRKREREEWWEFRYGGVKKMQSSQKVNERVGPSDILGNIKLGQKATMARLRPKKGKRGGGDYHAWRVTRGHTRLDRGSVMDKPCGDFTGAPQNIKKGIKGYLFQKNGSRSGGDPGADERRMCDRHMSGVRAWLIFKSGKMPWTESSNWRMDMYGG